MKVQQNGRGLEEEEAEEREEKRERGRATFSQQTASYSGRRRERRGESETRALLASATCVQLRTTTYVYSYTHPTTTKLTHCRNLPPAPAPNNKTGRRRRTWEGEYTHTLLRAVYGRGALMLRWQLLHKVSVSYNEECTYSKHARYM